MKPLSQSSTRALREQTLEQEIDLALSGLRSSLLDALEGASLKDERSPRSLAQRLKVDPKLAWRVVHLTEPSLSMQSARYVPGQGSLRTLLSALEDLGSTDSQLGGVRRAALQFDSLVERHLGSRRGLDAMLAGSTPDPNDTLAVELRRAGFESNASGLGIRAESQDMVAAQFAGDDPNYIDIAGVRATKGLERLRPSVPWRVARPYPGDQSAAERRQVVIEPLDPDAHDESGLHLVPALCSKPLPEFVPLELENGIVEYELSPGPLGVTGRRDLVYADRWRYSEPITAKPDEQRRMRLISRMRVPCEKARWVLLTPTDLFMRVQPEVALYTMVWRNDTNFQEPDRLPLALTARTTTLQSLMHEDEKLGQLTRWCFDRVRGYADSWVMTITELSYPPMISAATFSWDRKIAAG